MTGNRRFARYLLHLLQTGAALGRWGLPKPSERAACHRARSAGQVQVPLVGCLRQHAPPDSPRKEQKNFAWWRIHALGCVLLDTGCRVQELLDARVPDFDLYDLLVTVVGKGDKQRRIPFSVELRRILFRYLQQRERFGSRRSMPGLPSWHRRDGRRPVSCLTDRFRLGVEAPKPATTRDGSRHVRSR